MPSQSSPGDEENLMDEAELGGVGVSASPSGPYAGILTPITAVRLKVLSEVTHSLSI
jgi:hypothetical protein